MKMNGDAGSVGFKRPPVGSRFKKGQSGNPSGRAKKKPDFFEDAAHILGGTVTGRAKGGSRTLPMLQVVFRATCRAALQGDNRALRHVIALMLTLTPETLEKEKKTNNELASAKRRLAILLGDDPDEDDCRPRKPTPADMEREKRLDELVRKKREELIRNAKSW